MFTGNAQSPSLLASFPEWIICVLEFIAAFPTVLEGIISASSPPAPTAAARCSVATGKFVSLYILA